MSPEALVVVGDRFEEFLANRGTVPVSVLLDRLRAGELPESLALAIGQGLTDNQLAELRDLMSGAAAGIPHRAERALTHKHRAENVLVGPVRRLAEDRFTADLVLDERVEVLADHLTGQHIPAITILEAARQLWTVVTEQYLIAGTERTRFVIGSVNSSFHSFVFPMPATLRYELLGHSTTPVGAIYRCRVGVHHGDEPAAAVVEAEYRVIPEKLSAKQEAMAARRAIAAQVAALSEAAEAEAGAAAEPERAAVPA
ncbi:AfsA-related hotdog domain-containing protein [Streptomyces specialis]|uniref:AfsA-related hotdog domain-containing protein n=1 Tax=Streptomyces specialis TaxID=498367 RepID=UPI00073E3E05|nr:AfsA-related hotdog domain-containing protein [Streptomyces specialis]